MAKLGNRRPRIRRGVASGVLLLGLLSPQARAAERPYLEAAEKAAAWLQSVQIRTPQGLRWPADPRDPGTTATNLYAGSPGVVLFFLEAYYATGKKEFLDEARAGAADLLSSLSSQERTGLYEGAAGVGFVLEEVYKATGDSGFREGFLSCLRMIAGRAGSEGSGVVWATTTDIISGGAGTGLFLIYAARELGDPSYLDLAEKAGRRLVELAIPEGDGLKWAMDPGFPALMPNFSHGTAGVAYFLATLYGETKKKDFLGASLDGARYLLSVARTEGDVCLLFHDEPEGKDLYYLGWCHGPAGTARLFYRLAEVAGDESWMEWVWKSANGILQSGIPEKEAPGLWNNVGMCCGLASVGDFFLSLYQATGEKRYMDFCRSIADKIIAKGTEAGGRMSWLQSEFRKRPDFLVAQTGYMQGAAGIGTFLLRLDGLDRGFSKKIILPDNPFVK